MAGFRHLMRDLIDRRQVRSWAGLIGAVAMLHLWPSHVALSADSQPNFNRLTHLVIDEDGRGVRLFGVYDPAGPTTPIPYERLLADALELPEEQGDPLHVGSVPGFSLEMTDDSKRQFATAKQFNDAHIVRLAFEQYFSNPTAYDQLVEAGLEQALSEIRPGLATLLSSRMDRADADETMERIKTADDLMGTLRLLQRNGILTSVDDDALVVIIDEAILRFQTTPGNVFFYPEGTGEGMTGMSLFAEPKFSGIESDTQLARVVFEADVAVKELAAAPGYKMKSNLPFHHPRLEWQYMTFGVTDFAEYASGEMIVLVLVPKAVELGVSADGRVITFDRVDAGIWVAPKQSDRPPSRADLGYGDFLSAHYDDYAREIGSLWEFRELLKILGTVRQLKAAGVSLRTPSDRSWAAPLTVPGTWDTASLGTGDNFAFTMAFSGGVTLQVQKETKISAIAPVMSERMRKAADSLSARQLASASATPNAGVCFDGQPGCRPGESLGAVWVGNPLPSGAAGVSQSTLERMKRTPETKQLLETEEKAKAALAQARSEVQQKEAALSKAATAAEKGRLQVDLVKARQMETNTKSAARVAEINVEKAAKIIEEVELVDPKATPAEVPPASPNTPAKVGK